MECNSDCVSKQALERKHTTVSLLAAFVNLAGLMRFIPTVLPSKVGIEPTCCRHQTLSHVSRDDAQSLKTSFKLAQMSDKSIRANNE